MHVQINLQAKERVAYVYETHGTNSRKMDTERYVTSCCMYLQ